MYRIAGVEELNSGEMKTVDVDGKEILLIRTATGFYAAGSRCTHMGCKLVKGALKEETLTCPCHHSRFDVPSGQVIDWIPKWPGFIGSATKKLGFSKPLPTYPLEIRGEDIYLRFTSKDKEG